ncbi:MAG: MBL fold metallo-hydrolase [Halobacteriales archaeon]|nr:MBL fold metallo-hydrolase [Halobacteriales archaeon]
MEVTILASGSPLPTTTRGGQSLAVRWDDEVVLIDCGPLCVERLLESGFELRDIETLFFSHQHMDHNASFFHFAITSWMYGRRQLTVYGPAGTEALLDSLERIYRQDFEYRSEFGRPIEAVTDIGFDRVGEGFEAAGEAWTATAMPVEHSIETYAYRIEDGTHAVVYSADTGQPEPLYDFASGADILVQNCGVAPGGGAGSAVDRESFRQYRENNPPHPESPMAEQHCTPEQAATVGARAGVDTLVLTHLTPLRDTAAIERRASDVFDGEIHVASDGLTLTA